MASLQPLRDLSRQRQLAGNGRAGVWSREKARNTQRRYVRAHWRSLSGIAAIGIALFVVTSILTPSAFESGFILGAGLAGIAGLLTHAVTRASGSSPQLMGDLAEQWTAGELRRLRKDGWRVINHFSLSYRDIDHVLIGPGGVYAIETKWSSHPWTVDPPEPRLIRAARQSEGNARSLRLWTGLKAAGISDVRPVVMLWGTETEALPTVTPFGEVLVVAGPNAKQWRATLPIGGHLQPSQIEAAWCAFEAQLRMRDTRDASLTSLRPSVLEVTGMGLVSLITADLAVLTWAALLSLPWSLYWGVPVLLSLAAFVLPLRRLQRYRYLMLGWLSGLGVAAATTIASVLAN